MNLKHRIVGQTLLDLADVDLSQGKLVSILRKFGGNSEGILRKF